MKPNYGASSDLLRYLILWHYGGAYFDCTDVRSGEISLDKFLNSLENEENQPGFWVDSNSQGGGEIGNDTFIVEPKHPLMKQIYLQAIYSYSREVKIDFRGDRKKIEEIKKEGVFTQLRTMERYPSNTNILGTDFTINCTGPEQVRQNIKKTNFNIGYIPEEYLSKNKQNTTFWLDPSISQNNQSLALDEVIEQAINSICLDIKFTGLLNLDKYVGLIFKVMEPNKPDKTEVCEKLLKSLDVILEEQTFLKEQIKYVTPVSDYSSFNNYYFKNFSSLIFNNDHIARVNNRWLIEFVKNSNNINYLRSSFPYINAAIDFFQDCENSNKQEEFKNMYEFLVCVIYYHETLQNLDLNLETTFDKIIIQNFLKTQSEQFKKINQFLVNNEKVYTEYVEQLDKDNIKKL
jgi:hypothetical protein